MPTPPIAYRDNEGQCADLGAALGEQASGSAAQPISVLPAVK
jgi:hypothetical protein